MIYLIDDKVSRQTDYGWPFERIAGFANITAINNLQSLEEKKSDLFSTDNNIILFHESFLNSSDLEVQQKLEAFKYELKEHEGKTPIAYFSGSKNSRWIDNEEKVCMMSPDILYYNLSFFAKKCKNSDFNFRYLLFGENMEIESRIKHDLDEINNKNWTHNKFCTEGNIFYAFSENYACDCLFDNALVNSDWDFSERIVSDEELDRLVKEWFAEREYDAIYIPLCFGQTLSDYMGLRMAMHIRLTDTKCKYKPIYIYGEVSIDDIQRNDCFDILKSTGVALIHCDFDSMKLSSQNRKVNSEYILEQEIKNIHLPIPTNIGDNHSISNQWAIYRWKEMLIWNEKEPEVINADFSSTLYFKYLVARFGKHERFKKQEKKYSSIISGIEGKIIVYIDDEYDKGWGNIMEAIFNNSKASFICYKDFSKKYNKSQLIDKIQFFLNENEADCYLIDLRLHEDDFSEDSNLTGHQIANFIKQSNKGNQIVVFTASNKIWNLKKELFKIGAIGYALKESPESNYTREESKQQFIEFSNVIRTACKLSYLKDLYNKQTLLKKINQKASDLDSMIELLAIDGGNNNPDVLKSVLLVEIVFLEHYINYVGNLSLYKTGEGITEKVVLCKNKENYSDLTGHLFIQREEITKGYTNVVDVCYSSYLITKPSCWSNVTVSDATLTIAALLLFYKIPIEDVRLYINIKLIRNTQVAHNGYKNEFAEQKYKDRLSITQEKLVDFYNKIIVPVVLKDPIPDIK